MPEDNEGLMIEALLASRGMLLWYRREAPVQYQPAAGAMEGVLAKINAAIRTAAPQVNEEEGTPR